MAGTALPISGPLRGGRGPPPAPFPFPGARGTPLDPGLPRTRPGIGLQPLCPLVTPLGSSFPGYLTTFAFKLPRPAAFFQTPPDIIRPPSLTAHAPFS